MSGTQLEHQNRALGSAPLGSGSAPSQPSGSTTSCLRLEFRETPLRTVLSYLREAADLTVEVEPDVEIERTIDLWNQEPVSREHALDLLSRALATKGYAAVHKGRTLAILESRAAKKLYIPLPTVAGAKASE